MPPKVAIFQVIPDSRVPQPLVTAMESGFSGVKDASGKQAGWIRSLKINGVFNFMMAMSLLTDLES